VVRWFPTRNGTSPDDLPLAPGHDRERRFLAMTAGPQPLIPDCAALGCGRSARTRLSGMMYVG
jgi:hypothetical protein